MLSADGRYLFFLSDASNFVTNVVRAPGLSFVQLYRRDLERGQIQLISVTLDGASGGDITNVFNKLTYCEVNDSL